LLVYAIHCIPLSPPFIVLLPHTIIFLINEQCISMLNFLKFLIKTMVPVMSEETLRMQNFNSRDEQYQGAIRSHDQPGNQAVWKVGTPPQIDKKRGNQPHPNWCTKQRHIDEYKNTQEKTSSVDLLCQIDGTSAG